MTSDPKHRRLLSFSLRSLLVLMLLSAAFCGGWAARDWQLQRQQQRAQAEADRQAARARRQAEEAVRKAMAALQRQRAVARKVVREAALQRDRARSDEAGANQP